MKNAVDIVNTIITKKSQFEDIWSVMDKDKGLLSLKETAYQGDYDMLTKSQQGLRNTEVNIVSNDPKTYNKKVHETLASAERQISIRMAEAEGEDKREGVGKLERLLEFAFEKADERLAGLALPPLRDSLIESGTGNGWLAGRFLVYKDGENVIFDFIHYDPRFLVYQMGVNGLLWSAHSSFLTAEELEDGYEKDTKTPWYKPWEKKQDKYEVIDYWEYEKEGRITNAIICDKSFLKEPETYDIPSMPVLIRPIPGGSIFASCRDLMGTRDKFVSIVATHANIMSKQPLINYRDTQGAELKDTIYYAGGVIDLVKDHQKLEPAPMKDISPTVIGILDWLNDQIERATLPNIPIGKPPPSGTLFGLAREAGNIVFNPQLRALNYFYADICRLTEEQLSAGGVGGDTIKRVKVKVEQKRKYYETSVTPIDLKKPHIIKVEFTARTPWTQLDTYQIADMAKRLGLPDSFIQEHILRLPDPKLIQDLSALEVYEHSPEGMMKRAVEVLMDRGYVFEAQKLIEQMDLMEAQDAEMGATEAVSPREGGEGERTLPLAAEIR